MTKKLIASLVLIVLVAGAFVSSSLYINSLNKAHYEQITQADINDLKARIASALKPLWESQGLDSTILLELADEIDMSLEASPYKSGLLHSSGTLTLKFNAQHASSVLYIDAQFSNLPFGTSVFSLSSPDSQALFSEGKIGVIELSGTTLALRLSDLQIDRDNWRGGKDTLVLKNTSLTLHATKDFALKNAALHIPEILFKEDSKQFGLTNLVMEGSYDTPLDYQAFLAYIKEPKILAGKSKLSIQSLEFAGFSDFRLSLNDFSLKATEKLGTSADIGDMIADFAIKSLVIATDTPYAPEDFRNFKLDITDFASTLEIANLHENAIEYLSTLNDPYAFLLENSEEFEQKIHTILVSNPKLAITNSSFLLNGNKLTYSGDGQITPEFGEFNFALSSKLPAHEILSRYKDMGDFDTILEGISEYFIKQEDSTYGITLRYHQIHDGAQSFKVNNQTIYEYDPSRYENLNNAGEEIPYELNEDDLQELDSLLNNEGR
ncbi:hypothetical protein [uncultured Helicobacter sp.]|uniref:hypothetical protein n=1 Tax=uncultured Helicobacter sp. TaxID=175537 RepID=UPI003753A4F7